MGAVDNAYELRPHALLSGPMITSTWLQHHGQQIPHPRVLYEPLIWLGEPFSTLDVHVDNL